jgi:hypothetical protein
MSFIKSLSLSTRLCVLSAVGTCIATLIITHREQRRRVKNGRNRSSDDDSDDKEPKSFPSTGSVTNILFSRLSATTRSILRSLTREVRKLIISDRHKIFKLLLFLMSTVELTVNNNEVIRYPMPSEDVDYSDLSEDNGFAEDHKHRGPFYPHQNQFIGKHFPTRDSFNLMEELPCDKVSDEIINNDDEDNVREFQKRGQ